MAKEHIVNDYTVQETNAILNNLVKSVRESNGVGVTEYGIGFVGGSSASAGTRFTRKNGVLAQGENVPYSFTAGVGDTECVNDFESCTDFPNFNPSTFTTKAGKFKRFKKSFYGTEVIGIYEVIWVCAERLYDFYKLPLAFYRNGEEYWNYQDLSCYELAEETIDETVYAVSKPDLYPSHNRTREQMQTYATNWHTLLGVDTDYEYYHLITMSQWCEILTPILTVMFGTKNTQSIYMGVCYCYTTYMNIVDYEAGDSSTTLYLTGSCAFRTGGTLGLFESQAVAVTGGDDTNYCQATAVTSGSGTTTSGAAYTYTVVIDKVIDGSEGYNYVVPLPYKTGVTDYNANLAWQNVASLKGNSGCYQNNGYYPFKVLGLENIWGNTWTNILDCTIYNYVPYICTDITAWSETSTPASNTNFKQVGYSVCTAEGYITEMGVDDNRPDVRLPVKVGGSSSTHYADYYWVGNGSRTVYVGGRLGSSLDDGLCYWALNSVVRDSYWDRCSRLSHSSL